MIAYQSTLKTLLERSVLLHTTGSRGGIQDTALCLSGGVDSTLLLQTLSDLNLLQRLKLFTFSGFSEKPCHDSLIAGKTAEYFGKDITHVFLPDRIPLDYLKNIYSRPAYYCSDPSLLYFDSLANRIADSNIPVALTGDGGDELSGGYRRLRYQKIFGFLPKFVRSPLRLAVPLLSNERYKKILSQLISCDLSAKSYMDMAIVGLSNLRSEIKGRTYDSYSDVDFISFAIPNGMVRADAAFLTNGVENRSPFIEPSLYKFCKEKSVTKKDFIALIDHEISTEILRSKKGFELGFSDLFCCLSYPEVKDLILSNNNLGHKFQVLRNATKWDEIPIKYLNQDFWNCFIKCLKSS